MGTLPVRILPQAARTSRAVILGLGLVRLMAIRCHKRVQVAWISRE
jgi:hypothetical protein